jgi:hypothetical protein|tara:strand:- start:370 stop:735 length:366 start_codon:yes stop_codon:yes gene_type:complete
MKSVREYLKEEWDENSGYITKKGIMDNCFDRLGSYAQYADIEGMYMAVYSYWSHNVEDINEVENSKYVGYELTVDHEKTNWLRKMYGKDTIQLVIPQWVMNLGADSERHASNLFSKYLKIV